MKKKWYEFILITFIFVMPYTLLGEELSNIVLAVLGITYLLWKSKEEIFVDKRYILLGIGLVLTAIISLLFTVNLFKSLSGLVIYINAVVYYLVFLKLKGEKQEVINLGTIVLAIFSLIFIAYQGAFFKLRIYGTIGYSNTYALLMLIGLYLNETNKESKFYSFIQYILTLAIIYTGSRNTIAFLGVYLVICSIEDYKKKKAFNAIFYSMLAAISYVFLSSTGIAGILCLPVILYIIYVIYKPIKEKKKNILIGVLALISVGCLFTIRTNTAERIKNTSITSGVFQERLVYYEDAIKSIGKNPLGSGINCYEYKQYEDATAFYDVKYIHNSFLQVAYDMGIEGLAFFIVIAIYGFYVIYRSNDKNKIYYLMLYLTIYLHSLLDFDFSYSTVFIVISMLVAFYGQEKIVKAKVSKGLKISSYSLIIAFISYLFIINLNYVISGKYIIDNKYSEARNIININKHFTYKDSELYYNLAKTYKQEYDNTVKESDLRECLANLQKAEELNKHDTRIQWNMAYVYGKLKMDDKAIEYMDKLLISERYYYKMYQSYYNFLKSRYEATKNSFYSDKLQKLEQSYYNNLKTVNPRAKYMKNQLQGNYEDMLKLE